MAANVVKNVVRPNMTTDLVKVHQQHARIVVTIRVKILQADLIDDLGGVGQIGMDCRGIEVAIQVGAIQWSQVVNAEDVRVQVKDAVQLLRQVQVCQEPVVYG